MLTIIITAILSALHGYGKVDKIIPTLAMMAYCTIMLFLSGTGAYSCIGLIIGFLWRIVTRGGRQAHVELQAMDTRVYYSAMDKIKMVGFSHYCNPFGFLLGFIIAKWLNYDKIPYEAGDSDGKRFFDTRRYVEMASGALPQAAFVILAMEAVRYVIN